MVNKMDKNRGESYLKTRKRESLLGNKFWKNPMVWTQFIGYIAAAFSP